MRLKYVAHDAMKQCDATTQNTESAMVNVGSIFAHYSTFAYNTIAIKYSI
jgi:hypothetical protein